MIRAISPKSKPIFKDCDGFLQLESLQFLDVGSAESGKSLVELLLGINGSGLTGSELYTSLQESKFGNPVPHKPGLSRY